jgi:hypothetical protein
MDFSKLNQNEKLAVYGSAAVIIGGLVGYSYGMTVLAVIVAFAMLAVVFLPQFSPNTNLPGSRGSLLLITGGVAGVILLLALLLYISTIFTAFNVRDLFFILAVAGGVLMAWAGWQEFQAEGGKFMVGSASAAGAASTAPATSDTTAAPPPSAPRVDAQESAPVAEPRTDVTTEDAEPDPYRAPDA